MSEWQPIETAPKDGTTIVLFQNGKPYAPCLWEPAGTISEDAFWMWFVPPEGGWISEICKPTHWMPLPLPPKGTET